MSTTKKITDYHKVYSEMFADRKYSVHDRSDFSYEFASKHFGPPTTLVDIGTGRGVFIDAVKDNHPNVRVLCMDLDDFTNRKHGVYRIDLSQKSCRDAIRQMQPVDLITCLGVIEHLEEEVAKDLSCVCAHVCERAIFTVGNHSDILHDYELHIIQEGQKWWEEVFLKDWKIRHFEAHHGDRLLCFHLESRYVFPAAVSLTADDTEATREFLSEIGERAREAESEEAGGNFGTVRQLQPDSRPEAQRCC